MDARSGIECVVPPHWAIGGLVLRLATLELCAARHPDHHGRLCCVCPLTRSATAGSVNSPFGVVVACAGVRRWNGNASRLFSAVVPSSTARMISTRVFELFARAKYARWECSRSVPGSVGVLSGRLEKPFRRRSLASRSIEFAGPSAARMNCANPRHNEVEKSPWRPPAAV